MKRFARPVARRLLPLARALWGVIPAPIQARLRPGLRRARTAFGLGHWGQRANPNAKLIADFHPAVPLPIPEPTTTMPTRPVTPPEPVVTVVITAHDDGAFIDTALHSVRRQDLREWECVVVDDASVDNTCAVVLRHAEEDPRISLVRRDRNVGLAAARNTGIASARGEFVTFLDADDFMFPSTLGARIRAARSDDPRVAGSWCDWASVDEATGLEYQPKRAGSFDTIDYLTGGGENQVISTSPMVRRDVMVSLGGYDDDFRTAEDFEFATRLFRNGFRLVYAGVVGVAYRQKRASMIAGDPHAHARNAMRVYDYMAAPLEPSATSALATAPFIDPPTGVPSPVKRLERLITFLTFAVLSDDDAQRDGVYGLLPAGLLGASTFLVDVDGRIDGAIRRHATRTAGVDRVDRTRAESAVKALLAQRGTDVAPATPVEPHRGVIVADRITSLPPVRSRVRPERPLAPVGPWDVLLCADNPDAVRELLLVGRELGEQGLSVAMVDTGTADARRAMWFEAVHRVTHPLGPARLLISSAGQSVNADIDAHLVVSAEPHPLPGGVAADHVHLRGDWEGSDSWLDQVDIVGWHSRHDRLAAAGRPADGQARRGRSDVVLVMGSPDERHCARSLREATGRNDLLFVGSFQAGVSHTLPGWLMPGLTPHAHAVILVGDCPAPAEALAFGTPILRVSGNDGIDTGELRAALAAAEASAVHVDPNRDPLGRHVDRALRMLKA